jgi:hypothetical protein
VELVLVVTYTTEPDGTRVYAKGWRYKPLELHERKYRVLKPADAEERGAERFAGKWWYPLDLVPDEARAWPWTRDDAEAVEHELGCLCHVCRTVDRVKRLKRERLFRGG